MTKRIVSSVVAALLTIAIATPAAGATPAPEPESQQLALLEGVDAQALGAAEMDAIHGALTGQDLFNRLLASALLIQDPTLQAKVVAYLTANQTQLVAFFNRILSFQR